MVTRKIAFVRPAFETTTRRVTKMYDEWTPTRLLIKAIEFILGTELTELARAFPWKCVESWNSLGSGAENIDRDRVAVWQETISVQMYPYEIARVDFSLH